MKANIKVFPIAGLCEKSLKLEIALEKGTLDEIFEFLQGRFGENLKTETLMLMHNGRRLDLNNNTVFKDGDQLWLLPLLSGG